MEELGGTSLWGWGIAGDLLLISGACLLSQADRAGFEVLFGSFPSLETKENLPLGEKITPLGFVLDEWESGDLDTLMCWVRSFGCNEHISEPPCTLQDLATGSDVYVHQLTWH